VGLAWDTEGLEIAGLDLGIELIMGYFCLKKSIWTSLAILVRAGRFFPGGPAVAAVVVPVRRV
jgi:hypothetical protein